MTAGEMVAEIEECRDSSGPIPLSVVRKWMLCDDIEVQGQTSDLVTYPPWWERIEPPLGEDELTGFLLRYYRRCFLEDPVSDLADSRYGIAREIVEWYAAVPQEEDVLQQGFLSHVKGLLRSLYVEGADDVRDAIVCGALEHILEDPRWRSFFSDWQAEPALAAAYGRAMDWAVAHERVMPTEERNGA